MKKENQKEEYKRPELEIIRFEETDILTSSGFGGDDGNDTPEMPL